MEISLNQENFCRALLTGISPFDAYRKTFDCVGIDDAKVKSRATSLYKRKVVQDRISELRNLAARAAILDGAKVVDEWMHIATADPSELIRYERNCCRYCHGKRHAYQWRDDVEYAEKLAQTLDYNARTEQTSKHLPLPENVGGYGYAFNALPNPNCPRCLGEGEPRVFIADTRTLSPSARRLYAGIKQTKDGLEIKMRDPDAALLNLAKYFKVLAPEGSPTVNINQSGPVTNLPEIPLPVDAMQAAKAYQDIMQGKAK